MKKKEIIRDEFKFETKSRTGWNMMKKWKKNLFGKISLSCGDGDRPFAVDWICRV